jgi:hypothetical protein
LGSPWLKVRGALALWNTGCVVTLSDGSILLVNRWSHAS